MDVDGACLCGHLTYEARIDPDRCVVCHCNDCQMHSASAYGMVVHIVEGLTCRPEMLRI